MKDCGLTFGSCRFHCCRSSAILLPLSFGAFSVDRSYVLPTHDSTEAPIGPTKVIDLSTGPGGLEVIAERLGRNVLRMTRPSEVGGPQPLDVQLFVADSMKRALRVQAIPHPPFTALFDVTPDVAYVGVTARYADGVEKTTLVPYAGWRY